MNLFGKLKRLYWAMAAFAALLWIALVASVVSLAVGCAEIPAEERQELYGYASNVVERVLAAVEEERADKPAAPTAPPSDAAAKPPAADSTADAGQSASAAASGTLVYKYGGFDGSRAVEDPNTQIKNLRMSRDGLSYQWAKGNLGNWGLSREEAGALACAGYWDGKQWIMAKFDWISTSRTTRGFENIYDHYNGWKPEPFFAAPKRAFCIVSEDGKRRTNLLETKEP